MGIQDYYNKKAAECNSQRNNIMSDGVSLLPEMNPRVETGPVQFGNDFPGLFLRGDNCMNWITMLNAIGYHNNCLEQLQPFIDICSKPIMEKKDGIDKRI